MDNEFIMLSQFTCGVIGGYCVVKEIVAVRAY